MYSIITSRQDGGLLRRMHKANSNRRWRDDDHPKFAALTSHTSAHVGFWRAAGWTKKVAKP